VPDLTRILVIEDEPAIRRFLKAGLGSEGLSIVEAETGESGIQEAARLQPSLVLLDLGLPDIDGLEVVRRIREWSEVPIIVLSARGQESDKIAALDAGADDYLTKPFSIGELQARIRVALRHLERGSPNPEPIFEDGDLRVDVARQLVFKSGQELRLTAIEFRLLALLVRNAGRVLTHRQILTAVWGSEYEFDTHTLRVHMGNLRQKIEDNPATPRHIRTEVGVGYRLLEPN